MTDFVSKRLQVFVSSTFDDLKPERQAAVEAILTAGYIPAGMELFTSGDESQMDAIKQWIDESDVYLLILGGRYGTIEPKSKKSYTHLEYEYAIARGKPFFACVVGEAAQEQRVKDHGTAVMEMVEPKKLQAFRKDATSKMVRYWDDKKDIKIAVGETLANFSRRDDLVGWVRPTGHANAAALADEIARLSKENAELRAQLSTANAGPLYCGLLYDDMMALLKNQDLDRFFFSSSPEWIAEVAFDSRDDIERAHRLARTGLVRKTSDSFQQVQGNTRWCCVLKSSSALKDCRVTNNTE